MSPLLWLALPALAGTVPPPPFGARLADARPELSGPEETLDSEDGFFRVHFTREGVDAPNGGDTDGDGLPDAATVALDTLVEARAWYDERGWRPLIRDDGVGGSDAIDLYIQTVDINGYAHGVPMPGETDRGSCWIEVDGALAGTGRVFDSVVAHELHHCVQYRYTWASHSWIYEATSSYEQYVWDSSGALRIAMLVLWQWRLEHPEWPIDDLAERYEYAGMTFVKFWEDFGGQEGVHGPALWEALEAEPRWRLAFDTEAQRRWGISFDEAFLEYATWNGFACARDDGQHWVEDEVSCTSAYEIPLAEIAADTSFDVAFDEVTHTAAYFELPAAGEEDAVEVTCSPPGIGATLGLALLALDEDGTGGETSTAWASGDVAPLTLRLQGGLEPDGRALVVAVSTDGVAVDTSCIATRVPAEEEEPDGPATCGCVSGGGPAAAWPAGLLLIWLGAGAFRRGRTNRPGGQNPGPTEVRGL